MDYFDKCAEKITLDILLKRINFHGEKVQIKREDFIRFMTNLNKIVAIDVYKITFSKDYVWIEKPFPHVLNPF